MRATNLNIAAIYTITCIETGKVYVGQTINVRKRWESHRHYLARGTHRNQHLQRAWAKYGAEAFVFEVCALPLPGLPLEVALNDLEIAVLGQAADAYNLNEVGEPRMRVSAETRAKLSAQRKALWGDPTFKEKMREAQRAAHANMSQEQKLARSKAISEGQSGSEAAAAKSTRFKALWESEEHRAAQTRKRRANWQDPAYAAQQRASRIAASNDPEVKARRSAGLKAAWARRKAEGY